MKRGNYLEWVDKAEQDFKAALHLNKKTGDEKYPDQVCFLSQQTAEKYLKSFLVFCGIEPPYSHDLFRLTNLCMLEDPQFSEIIDVLKPLTPYATEYRYPGESAIAEEAEDALQRTKEIRRFIREKLGLEE